MQWRPTNYLAVLEMCRTAKTKNASPFTNSGSYAAHHGWGVVPEQHKGYTNVLKSFLKNSLAEMALDPYSKFVLTLQRMKDKVEATGHDVENENNFNVENYSELQASSFMLCFTTCVKNIQSKQRSLKDIMPKIGG